MSTPRRSWTITLGASVLATLAGGAFAATTGYAPDAWMRGAVGGPISTRPLLDAAKAALAAAQ